MPEKLVWEKMLSALDVLASGQPLDQREPLYAEDFETQSEEFEKRRKAFLQEALACWQPDDGCPGLQVRGSAFSRMTACEYEWIRCGEPGLTDQEAESILGRYQKKKDQASFPINGVFVLVEPIFCDSFGTHSDHQSYLLSLFQTRERLERWKGESTRLVRFIATGLKLLRRYADQMAVQAMGLILSGAYIGDEVLPDMVKHLRRHTRSDGVKVYLLRRRPKGIRLQRLSFTEPDKIEKREYTFAPKVGMADWVIDQKTWLLIPDTAWESSKKHAAVFEGISGKGTGHKIRARLDVDHAAHDRETTIFLFPLIFKDQITNETRQDQYRGVVSIWREEKDDFPKGRAPFRPDLDTECLEQLATQIAIGSYRDLREARLKEQTKSLIKLANKMTKASHLGEVYQMVAKKTALLAGEPRAILFLKDEQYKQPVYLSIADWDWTSQPDKQNYHPPRWHMKLDVHPCKIESDKLFHDHAEISLNRYGRYLGNLERVPENPDENDKLSDKLSVLLLGYIQDGPDKDLWCVDDEICLDVATDFLKQAGLLINEQEKKFALTVKREFLDRVMVYRKKKRKSQTHEEVLRIAAEHLRNKTGAEVVLVHIDHKDGMRVRAASPDKPDIIGVSVQENSLTDKAIRKKEEIRVLDIYDPREPSYEEFNFGQGKTYEEKLKINRIRSFICQPVVVNERCIGALSLITSVNSIFLLPWHKEVASATAEAAAKEMHPLSRGILLDYINKMTDRLVIKEGADLACAMGNELKKIVTRFIDYHCDAFVVVTTHSNLLKLFAKTKDLDADTQKFLEQHSNSPERESDNKIDEFEYEGVNFLCQPFKLSGIPLVRGRLILSNHNSFTSGDPRILDEIARELAIIIRKERTRIKLGERMSVFRHALIGPIQGLANAARELYDIHSEKDSPEVGELIDLIEEEAENIRLWRENQRIYSDTIQLILKKMSLKDLFFKVFRRFKRTMESRGISFHPVWRGFDISITADQAGVDLVLSNLLDNAYKYSFANKRIEMGALSFFQDGKRWVRMWVEDEGHPIPGRLDEKIYELGYRLDWDDPIRPIQGTGLGLPMSKKIVESHGGKIYHKSKQKGVTYQKGDGKIATHTVTFYVEFPCGG